MRAAGIALNATQRFPNVVKRSATEPAPSASSHRITRPAIELRSMKQPAVSTSSPQFHTLPLVCKYFQNLHILSAPRRCNGESLLDHAGALTYGPNKHQLFDDPAAQSFPVVAFCVQCLKPFHLGAAPDDELLTQTRFWS